MTNSSFNLSDLNGSNGFVLNGIDEYDYSGSSVSSAGDINDDGIDDLIVGASGADPNGKDFAGSSYVVFGQTEGFSPNLDLSDFNGSNGFAINGVDAGDGSGSSVSGAGDLNGDGIDDLIIGGAYSDYSSVTSSSSSYVVFGQTDGFNASIDLSDLNGSNGFVINGNVSEPSRINVEVSSAGDINGDGIDDLIIEQTSNPYGSKNVNSSIYVVFGQTEGFSASFNLSDLNGSNGFVLNNGSYDRSVSSAGDINGDGIDDLIIGAKGADPNGKYSAGSSYVVFGQTEGFSASIDLSDLNGSNGFVLNGIDADDSSGASVSGAGDINGDGIDDLIIGAYSSYPNGKESAGSSYVVFGNAPPALDLNGSAAGIDFTTTFTGSAVAIVDTANLTLADPNSTTLAGAKVRITNLLDGADEVLVADTTGTGITANYSATGTLTLSGADTVANYQQVLQTLTYNNAAATLNTTDRTIEFVVDDGETLSNTSAVATTTLKFFDKIIDGTAGKDVLTATANKDFINGFEGNDILTGKAGDDLLRGGAGKDWLRGNNGKDTLIGGGGEDDIQGGAGNDFLWGGKGNDLLRGGGGADQFVLRQGDGGDTIFDFQDGQDSLLLDGLTFRQLEITQHSGSILIGITDTNKVLASLPGVQATALSSEDFSVLSA